jgi:cytochrome c biogenesis protein CcdA
VSGDNPAVFALAVLVASIGFADSLNPSTIAPVLLLASGRRGGVRVAAFTVGAFVVSLLGGLLIVLGPGQLLLDALPHPGRHAKSIALVIGGAILVVLATGIWVGRRHLAERIGAAGAGSRGARSAFLLGAGIMAVELPTAVPYFGAIAAILASRVSVGEQVVLLLLFNVAFVTPLLAILVVRTVAGERAAAAMEAFGVWMRRHAAALVAGLLGLAGTACAAVGLAGLV